MPKYYLIMSAFYNGNTQHFINTLNGGGGEISLSECRCRPLFNWDINYLLHQPLNFFRLFNKCTILLNAIFLSFTKLNFPTFLQSLSWWSLWFHVEILNCSSTYREELATFGTSLPVFLTWMWKDVSRFLKMNIENVGRAMKRDS